MSKKYSFEDFLVDDFNSTYKGTDDGAPEATERYIQELSINEALDSAITYCLIHNEEEDSIAIKEFFFKLLDK